MAKGSREDSEKEVGEMETESSKDGDRK